MPASVQFKLEISRITAKTLSSLPQLINSRIFAKIDSLKTDPFPPGVKKLASRKDYRVRIGDYRILYQVDTTAKLISVIAVGHRRNIYRLNDAATERNRYVTGSTSTTGTTETAPQKP